ncbi:MAG TPA: hypothetical protein GX707_21125 [Epulopiscium sp.]|nr:hypothetical protein [Candidatus Epulonipiscium sp.]
MTSIILEDLKNDYKEGFRCIHSEILNDTYIMQLKNFSTEKIKMLSTANPYEISKIKNYLECLEQVKGITGHDC